MRKSERRLKKNGPQKSSQIKNHFLAGEPNQNKKFKKKFKKKYIIYM
jgi:hypothetical protein